MSPIMETQLSKTKNDDENITKVSDEEYLINDKDIAKNENPLTNDNENVIDNENIDVPNLELDDNDKSNCSKNTNMETIRAINTN